MTREASANAHTPIPWGKALARKFWRWLRPPRKVRPTAAGWAFLGILWALFFAAINSGNNLLYLLLSFQFATVAVSGLLSEFSIRPLQASFDLPRTVEAGKPFAFLLRVENTSRWRSAYLVSGDPGGLLGKKKLEVKGPRWLGIIPPARNKTEPARKLLWQEAVASKRGVMEIQEAYLATRGPFGLFDRRKRIPCAHRLVVLPAPVPAPIPHLAAASTAGERTAELRGEGYDLRTLRPYQSGESARRIAWRASARTRELLVRETDRDEFRRVRISLEEVPSGTSAEILDKQAGIARFAAETLLREGYEVRLEGAAGYASNPEELANQMEILALWQGKALPHVPGDPKPAASLEVRMDGTIGTLVRN